MPEDSAGTKPAETRRLAAIIFIDIVGFSRQMGADEAHTLHLLGIHNQIIQQAVTEHHGTVIKTVGDAFLVDFPSVVHAVQCAQVIQAQFRTYNAELGRLEEAWAEVAEVLRLIPNASSGGAQAESSLQRSSGLRALFCRPAQGGAVANTSGWW
jgi:class 3 adenylate cyclase